MTPVGGTKIGHKLTTGYLKEIILTSGELFLKSKIFSDFCILVKPWSCINSNSSIYVAEEFTVIFFGSLKPSLKTFKINEFIRKGKQNFIGWKPLNFVWKSSKELYNLFLYALSFKIWILVTILADRILKKGKCLKSLIEYSSWKSVFFLKLKTVYAR